MYYKITGYEENIEYQAWYEFNMHWIVAHTPISEV